MDSDHRLAAKPSARMRRLMLLVSGLCAVLAALPRPATAAPLAGGTSLIEPSRRPDDIVVTYREILGEIGAVDHGPTLQIYGDGRMVAHYPHYMRRAGDYEQRLAAGELDQLLRSLAAKGLLDFDAAATRNAARVSATASRQRALAAQAPVTVFEAADASTTVIEIAVDRYRAGTSGAREVRNLTQRVAWAGLRAAAQQHADVPAIRDLAAAEQELRALRERPGFRRLR
jgi:hypothetical protein